MKSHTFTKPRRAKALLLLALITLTAATAKAQSYFYNYYTNIMGTEPFVYDQLEKLFDNNTSTGVRWEFPSDGMVWVEFETQGIIHPTSYKMTRYYNSGSSGHPKTWMLYAKLNASDSWTLIENVQNSNTFSEGDATQEFSLSNTQWYKYFRLEFYKVSNIDEVAAKEFAFQGYAIHNLDNSTLNGMQEEYLYLGAFMPDYSWTSDNGYPVVEGIHYTATVTNSNGEVVTTITEGGDYTLTIASISPNTGSKTFAFSVVRHWQGEGTSGNPFVINTTTDLNALAVEVNGGESMEGIYFRLNANLTYDTNTSNNHTPVGNGTSRFYGTFDGNNRTISGIRINRTNNYQGVFGTNSGTVKNLTLTDAQITGGAKAAGIVGDNWDGTIENCHVTNTVTVSGTNNVGGIAGWNDGGTVKNLTLSGAQVTGGTKVGGIVGDNWNDGLIENCHVVDATLSGSSHVGGIVGWQDGGLVKDCIVDDATVSAGGGAIAGTNNAGTFEHNYYIGCTVGSATVNVGTGSGDADGARLALPVNLPATLSYASGNANGIVRDGQPYAGATESLSLTADWPVGYTYTYTATNGTVSGSWPTFTLAIAAGATSTITVTGNATVFWGIANGANGSAERPYLITTTEDLDYLAYRVNEVGDTFYDTYFKLGNDIAYDPDNLTLDHDGDGTNESNYTAIGLKSSSKWFGGHFDGDGHTISGIRLINPSDCQGVFGYISGNENSLPEVKNLTLANAVISGEYYVGGIVGSNGFYGNFGNYRRSGTIENCHVTNTVNIHGIFPSFDDETADFGGIVGLNRGDISHCTSAATFTFDTSIQCVYNVGGIVGINNEEGTISHCTSTATFTFGTSVNRVYCGGGIVGSNNDGGIVSHCTSAPTFDIGNNQCKYGISGIAGENIEGGIISHCLTVGLTLPITLGVIVCENSDFYYEEKGFLDHNYYADCNVGGEASNIGYSYLDYDNFNYVISDLTENDGAVPLGILLQDDGTGNPEAIAAHLNQPNNIGIYGRTLYQDGKWNTLCLPFGVADFAGTPLEGADVRALESATFADGVVTLNFGEPLTAITAGTPYLVRWAAGGDDYFSPVFSGVTITATEPTTVSLLDGSVAFMGNYVPFAEPASLLLDAHNANNGAFHAALQVPEGCEVAYHFPSTCIDPEGFGADLVTATTAELGWDIPMPMEGYTVRYRTAEVQPILVQDLHDGIGDWIGTNYPVYPNNPTFFFPITPPSGEPAYLISPPLTGHTEGMTLEFKYVISHILADAFATFQIGFSSTDADLDSFTFGEEVTDMYVEGRPWVLYSVPVPAGTRHVCIKAVEVYDCWLYIDHIVVGRYIPAGMAGDPVFSEGFENGIGDWTLRDCVDDTGIQFSPTGLVNAEAHSGFGIFRFIGRNAYGQEFFNQYLITPMLEEVGESTMLEFYGYKTDVNNCTFQIGFSSTDTETASFTFGEEITSYNDFQYHRYSTPVPAGTKYICWKQVSGGIVLDDILVYHELWETVDVAGSGAHVATTIDGTHVSATLEGLTPGTDYEVQMKSDCDEAEWSETLAITTPDFEADGDIYTIYTADGWNAFCDALQYNGVYNRFIGKTVRLGADITVGRMAGGSGHEFMGTFDGQGHTLTVNYTTTAQFTAPFSYINGATIMNLTTGGTINTSAKFAGGMVGATLGVGTIEITNCVSDVTINSSVNGDGTHGGFLAVASYGAVNFTGCMFSGEMLGESTTLWAGFVGWTESNHNATVTFTDCLFNPTNLATNSGRTFSRARNMSSVTITNCYYTVPLGTAQGYPAVSDPNILPYGDPTGTYPVSDLTAYINGLMYGDVFYYNPESIVAQTVSLTAGKNWFSTNIEITLDALKAALVATGNASITIASQSEGNTTYANGRWRGSLTALDVKQMYKITVVTSCEIVLEGMPINPAEHPVTIHNGANWIGFPLGTSMALTDAFAGFAVNGDMVVSQSNGSATYTGGRWRGQLTTVEPGQGYIYKSSVQENRTFTFPMSTK